MGRCCVVVAGLDDLINSRMYKDEQGDWVCGYCGKTAGPKTNIRNHIGKQLPFLRLIYF